MNAPNRGRGSQPGEQGDVTNTGAADTAAADPAGDGPVAIPIDDLSEDALRGVVESFVLREGTDYGRHEYSLPQKVDHVLSQLRRREAQIVFNPLDESIDIVTKRR
ncbi:MAG TPA: YheU family protein [Steroidobacteraceae bacterium]|jgi:hypothetical protein|nr:YheU family protein [Steroidobacteraceae bacterium]